MTRIARQVARWLAIVAVLHLVFLVPFLVLGAILGARSFDDAPRWIALAGVAALALSVAIAGPGGAVAPLPTTSQTMQGEQMTMAAMTAEYAWKEQDARRTREALAGDAPHRRRAFTGRWDHLAAGLVAVTGILLIVEAWAAVLLR